VNGISVNSSIAIKNNYMVTAATTNIWKHLNATKHSQKANNISF